jgi:hypothetical protein
MSSSPARVPPSPSVSSGSADSGRLDAIESLYRDSGRRSSALSPFDTALHPPEDADGYGWLYRVEPPGPAPTPDPALTATAPVLTATAPVLTATASVLTAPTPAPAGRRWLVPALLAAGVACVTCVTLAGVLLAGAL